MVDSASRSACGDARGGISARALIGLYALALAARAFFILAEPGTRLVADENVWTALAAELAAPGRSFSPFAYERLFHPPLYVYFIATIQVLAGTLGAVVWVQAAAGSLLAPLVARVGATSFDAKTGVAAGSIVALYPELVWYTAHYWSETLFAVLLWGAFERLCAPERRPTAAATAGLLWGLASLTRETALLLVPVVALWLLWSRPREWRRAALFVAACVLVVLPWTARNFWVSGSFVAVATRGSFNLWLANSTSDWGEIYREYESIPGGEVAQARYARARAVESIVSRQPGWLPEKLLSVMPAFWGVNDHVVIHLQRRAYRVPLAMRLGLTVTTVVSYLVVLGLALPWLVPTARGRSFALPLMVFGAYLAMHVVAFGSTRFRMPFLPVLFLLAARGLSLGWRAAWGQQRPAERVLTSMLAVALAASVAPSVRDTFTHAALWNDPPAQKHRAPQVIQPPPVPLAAELGGTLQRPGLLRVRFSGQQAPRRASSRSS